MLVKVSYSWMQNIKAILSNHTISILHQNNKIKDECNCRNNTRCPLGGKYLSSNVVYQGKITATQPNYSAKGYCRKVVQRIPLPMNITQKTQNCRKNSRKLKGSTLRNGWF